MATTLVAHSAIKVTIAQHPRAPQPLPLESGFSEGTIYEVVGVGDYSETSEAYFVLVNDHGQFYWISNRHVKLHSVERVLVPAIRSVAGSTKPGAVLDTS
jgi:hypothetical protein